MSTLKHTHIHAHKHTQKHTQTDTNTFFIRTSTGASRYCAYIAVLDVLQKGNSINESLGEPTIICILKNEKEEV